MSSCVIPSGVFSRSSCNTYFDVLNCGAMVVVVHCTCGSVGGGRSAGRFMTGKTGMLLFIFGCRMVSLFFLLRKKIRHAIPGTLCMTKGYVSFFTPVVVP